MTTTMTSPLTAPVAPVTTRSSWRSPLRGRESDPAWVRPSLLALLVSTAMLYLWGLGASGWANGFYTAAVQAGAASWKALFFGSFDSSSFITVDKPPVALWVDALSVKIFGLSSWSVLVPQALEGVTAVGLLYATVRRRFHPAAALLAGAVFALTPVAVLMFRFNNPDALLVLLLVAAAYAVVRALEQASTRWLLLASVLVGTAFLTKMLQAFLVVPVFALVYLFAAPTTLRRRLGQLLGAGLALLVASGWWVAIVELVPASARPYIGGSQNNSVLDLIFGYNGFGRITGDETGSVGGGAAGTAGRWGATGLTRMFNTEFGGQVAWLIPAALVLLVALLWLSRHVPRTDGRRAQVLLWGGWLVVTGLTFSLAKGIIHPYYAVALAPAIGALVGIGAVSLWQLRGHWLHRAALAVAVGATTVCATTLLGRTPTWHPGVRTAVVLLGTAAVVGLVAAPHLDRRLVAALPAVALVAALAGPAAYAMSTAATPHAGAIPSAGPTVAGARLGGGPGGFGGRLPAVPGGTLFGRGPLGGLGGVFQPPAAGLGGAGGAGAGGLLEASTPTAELVAALRQDGSAYTWVAAAVGANSAAGYQIAAQRPVMAIGGFNGSDPAPSLAQFQQYVREGKIHYFVAGGGLGGRFGGLGRLGGSNVGSQITAWVEESFTATTVGGVTLYDLTSGLDSAATG